MANFSSTPIEILDTVFNHLCRNPIDSFNFSRVSKEWRSIAIEKKRHILPRLMILPLQESQHTQHLLTLSSSTSNWEIPLPELREKHCLASNKGWLLIADESIDDIFLLDPLSKDQIPLPSLPPCPEKQTLIQYGVFSLNFNSTSDYLVTIIVPNLLLFYSTKVDKWVFKSDPNCSSIREIGFYKHQIFVIKSCYDGICHYFKVSSIYNFKGSEKMHEMTIDDKYEHEKDTVVGNIYFLETPKEELLMVYQYQETILWREKYTTVDFEVFKFDERNENWVKIEDLGDNVVFLGMNGACLLARDVPECTPNSIYFLDHRKHSKGRSDRGVFNMKDGCIKSLFFWDLCPYIHRQYGLPHTLGMKKSEF